MHTELLLWDVNSVHCKRFELVLKQMFSSGLALLSQVWSNFVVCCSGVGNLTSS